MARDGSGTYTRVEGPYVNGLVADADEVNNELDDISDALTDSINTAGTKAFGADQSMGGFKLTDLAAPSSANDAARKAYVDAAITAAAQPLDATLTALAALSWSSGNALVQFTAADTVSLTLTPSVSSVTASQGAANTTPSGTFVNTTDNASVRALRIEGDRATPANNDQVFASFYLSSGAGTQRESGRVTSQLWDVTNGAEYGAMLFGVMSAGSFVNMLYLNPFEFSPNTSDGVPLGSGSRMWSDLFLASGAVLNFNNGDVVVTHSSNALEVTGGGFAGPLLQVAGVGGETLTAAAHRNRQLLLDGNITLDDGVFAGGDWGLLTADGTNRTITRASGLTMYVNGVDSASATVPARTTAGFIYETASVCHIIGSAY